MRVVYRGLRPGQIARNGDAARAARLLAEQIEGLAPSDHPPVDWTSLYAAIFGERQELIPWGGRTRYKRWSDHQWCAPFYPIGSLDDLRSMAKRAGLDRVPVPLEPRAAAALILRAFAASCEPS